tara:strand:+ start:939 stop:1145 length:207 start_codon:yes stop_codon:yes gene_type:complete
MLLRGNLHDLASGGRGYGLHGYGDGLSHYGCGHYEDGDGYGHGCSYGDGGYGNVNIENHEDAEYVIER